MKKLLSGNEAFALGAYNAGLKVAAAYPGTPSTEILENLARYKDIHAEWSTNEKVAMEVGLGACYCGVRSLVSMKHVGLNVAADPFMAAATTGVRGGLVVITADDPGMHSSQNEQDNRYFAKFAKVPLLEPSDSQEAYDMMGIAFDISERFDTPVLVRTTTRISHAKTVVEIDNIRKEASLPVGFKRDPAKFVMLPFNARRRRPLVEERLVNLAEFSDSFALNKMISGWPEVGIITGGIAFQYAFAAVPQASFLKLGMTYPLPEKIIREFARGVEKLVIIEELEPFLEEQIRAMGIVTEGKMFIPKIGELNQVIVSRSAAKAGWISQNKEPVEDVLKDALNNLPLRPPLLCPGCPHTGIFSVLSSLGIRKRNHENGEIGLVITGDIGCYTLAAYSPLEAIDTCACMGAGIGQALGMEKAGLKDKVVAVIGDSTFLHSGITGLINAVYNKSSMTLIILDNRTTAMTGHQHHPGTGLTAQGEPTASVNIAELVRSCGVANVQELSAFDLNGLRSAFKAALNSPELVVLVVRGNCSAITRKRGEPHTIDNSKCNKCDVCLTLGCAAIRKENGTFLIDSSQCMGTDCNLCQQLCPQKAISLVAGKESIND
jgi:indolepyruvate ferredoxin oxidoreductase alpha subunit